MSAEIRVPQFRSFIGPDDHAAIASVFERNYLAEGPCAQAFQDALLELIGAPFGVFASNGTVALYLAMRALGLGPGDEVLVQDVTFIASANAVEMVGATPVFVDVPAFNDYTLDLDRITVTPRTRAVVVAHLFGTAISNLEEVADFCRAHGLLLIEDAAQAIGVRKQPEGPHCGTFGDVGMFSFYADKTITTGEGGFVVTADEGVYDRMRLLRNQGRRSSGTFVHESIGYNFRITDMQAALGLSQFAKLPVIVARKQEIANRYHERLQGATEPLVIRKDFASIPFRVVAFADDAHVVMERMRQDGVEVRSMFYPLHLQPFYAARYASVHGDYPNAEQAYRRGLCLPTFVSMTDEQIDIVCEAFLTAVR